MILMLLKKKQYKTKKEHSSRTVVKHKSKNPTNEIKEINDLIRKVSKVRANDFNIVTDRIPSFNDRFDTKTEKDFQEK